jgi:hypothetical protein
MVSPMVAVLREEKLEPDSRAAPCRRRGGNDDTHQGMREALGQRQRSAVRASKSKAHSSDQRRVAAPMRWRNLRRPIAERQMIAVVDRQAGRRRNKAAAAAAMRAASWSATPSASARRSAQASPRGRADDMNRFAHMRRVAGARRAGARRRTGARWRRKTATARLSRIERCGGHEIGRFYRAWQAAITRSAWS